MRKVIQRWTMDMLLEKKPHEINFVWLPRRNNDNDSPELGETRV